MSINSGDWTVLPNDIAVVITAMEIAGNPVVAVASWDGQVGLVKAIEERAARISAHTVALSKPYKRTLHERDNGASTSREQTYCYAAFASDTAYTVSEVTREFATNG
jgi:hypothetical protein